MNAPNRWNHGTVVVLQEVWHGKLWTARPARVVEDRSDLIALWCPAGTPIKGPSAPWRPGRSAGSEFFSAMLTHLDWLFADFSWPTSNLILVRPGDWYAVLVSWTGAGECMGWYVNFQRPFRRTERGIQTMDLMLDLIVDQDRRWRWKDEDEFEALVGSGIITDVEAGCVRDAAQAVLRDLDEHEPPFCHPWHDWHPEPSWATPELPDGWHTV